MNLFRALLLTIAILASSATARACGIYDFKVRPVPKSAPDLAAPPPMRWSREVAQESNEVWADQGFYANRKSNGLFSDWSLSKDDSELSQENTLLEFSGFLGGVMGLKGDEKVPVLKSGTPLTISQIRERFNSPAGRDALKGLSLSSFKNYPVRTPNSNGSMDLNDESSRLKTALETLFEGKPGDFNPGDWLLNKISDERNRPEIARQHQIVSRPTLAGAGSSQACGAECMALAYGQDYFTSTDHNPADLEIGLKSSVVDEAASFALRNFDPAKNALTKNTFTVGKSTCSLLPDAKFELGPLPGKCGGGEPYSQIHPVVRSDSSGSRNMIQVGASLYQVSCSGGQGSAFDMSDTSGNDVSFVLPLLGQTMAPDSKTGAVAPEAEIQSAAKILANLPPSDFEAAAKTVAAASAKCFAKFVAKARSLAKDVSGTHDVDGSMGQAKKSGQSY
jgi:hypothetical protein